MARSPSHRWGQIIGDLLEACFQARLRAFAVEHELYLDTQGPRPARGGKKKVAWEDAFGNSHDLDYVLERGGSAAKYGTPVAFIESAWRRYTKHSRNKAQEIQGAVVPLASKHHLEAPFKGVLLAGVFTQGSLQQLRSQGFEVLYLAYETVVEAFSTAGIDATWDEATPVQDLQEKINCWESLPDPSRAAVAERLLQLGAEPIQVFFSKLERAVTRQIDRVVVTPLRGESANLRTVAEALRFIDGCSADPNIRPDLPLLRVEVQVRYSNGDRVEGTFNTPLAARDFLLRL